MIRSLHRWFGLIAALLLIVITVSGAALSIFPVSDALNTPSAGNISVATLAERIKANEPTVEQIRRAPSGQITAYYFKGDAPVSSAIDPATGAALGTTEKSGVERWLINLHRSLFLDDNGRYAVAFGAVSMLILSTAGLFMLARRAGGWRLIFKPTRGTGDGRLHAILSRAALPGLLLSSMTGLWMVAATFDVLPQGAPAPLFPTEVSGQTGMAPGKIALLQQTPVDALRSLTFPLAGDSTDAFRLKTSDGEGYIDQGNGTLLAWSDANWIDKASHLATMLHTGRGLAWLGVILGLSALVTPVLSWTGLLIWLKGRGRQKIKSVAAADADTIVLVASESGTTWAFAQTLQSALSAAGLRVHVGPITAFNPEHWPKAKRVVLMAATYGDGAAPSMAAGFLDTFRRMPVKRGLSLAILGFGDRSFPAFCGFAKDIADAAESKGWSSLVPFDTVDRQSPQDFARWGRVLAQKLRLDFELNHVPVLPRTWQMELISKRDYGASVQAATSILRFALPKHSFWKRFLGQGFPRFEAGDLIAVVPEGSQLPRYYSLASGSKDGFVEICVRKHAGGLCSGQLVALEPGDSITAFVRANPGFRPQRGRKPVILIGAGTGIGPLAGFARANQKHRAMHLYFGTRHPASDAFYAEELYGWQKEGRLASVSTAFSRSATPAYVQDLLRADAAKLTKLIAAGGQILVCGGREMAAGVADALTDVLAPAGPSLATLKAEGRYAEDVY
ncbi:PepSY domain-containing protein [Rhizobium sp. L1K21]|uniref:PepSY domain-containing protein n=1 Tax=Rhizobium sp. L1K21 TaxID=2954933 RepID=UPI002092AD6B|nr:PepSY domain-containing protein [Rhizobium sp. L1K21]MCO6187051.1 PepSY domain-containing protein [Rhizobium sp. L1K21]